MYTLRIEHAITDYPTWRTAFGRFAEARTRAGVRRSRVAQPVDDPAYILIDLDFDSAAEAEQFRDFLNNQVWGTPNAPALVGAPVTRVLAGQPDS